MNWRLVLLFLLVFVVVAFAPAESAPQFPLKEILISVGSAVLGFITRWIGWRTRK